MIWKYHVKMILDKVIVIQNMFKTPDLVYFPAEAQLISKEPIVSVFYCDPWYIYILSHPNYIYKMYVFTTQHLIVCHMVGGVSPGGFLTESVP